MVPTISVVIPVFNRAEAVRRAIASVLAQTFGDFELIVVDDGSTDETVTSVAGFTDPRVRCIRHERKRGASAARNTGIRASTAPYVAFLDSDDEWLPTKLERQAQLFEGADDRLGFVYTGTERVYANGHVGTNIARRHADLTRQLLTINVVGETSVGMIRRRALEAVGGFDESLPASQDADLWLRLSEKFRADAVPDPLVRISKRDDPGRISVDAVSSTRGRELFLRKHAGKMKEQRVLHLFLRDLGWIYLRSARSPVSARRCYLDSLAAEPLAPKTWMMLLMVLLPSSWVDGLARLKHRIAMLRSSIRRNAGNEGNTVTRWLT